MYEGVYAHVRLKLVIIMIQVLKLNGIIIQLCYRLALSLSLFTPLCQLLRKIIIWGGFSFFSSSYSSNPFSRMFTTDAAVIIFQDQDPIFSSFWPPDFLALICVIRP